MVDDGRDDKPQQCSAGHFARMSQRRGDSEQPQHQICGRQADRVLAGVEDHPPPGLAHQQLAHRDAGKLQDDGRGRPPDEQDRKDEGGAQANAVRVIRPAGHDRAQLAQHQERGDQDKGARRPVQVVVGQRPDAEGDEHAGADEDQRQVGPPRSPAATRRFLRRGRHAQPLSRSPMSRLDSFAVDDCKPSSRYRLAQPRLKANLAAATRLSVG